MPSVSLRVFVTVMLALVAVASTTIVFVPMYTSGINSVKRTAQNLRTEISARLVLQLKTYFDVPMATVSSVSDSARLGMINVTAIASAMEAVCQAAVRTGLVSYVGNVEGQFGACLWFSGSPTGLEARLHLAPGMAPMFKHPVNNVTMKLLPSNSQPMVNFDPRQRPWWAATATPLGQGWSSVYLSIRTGQGIAFTAATATGSLFDPATGAFLGAFAVEVSAESLVEFLRTVQVGKTGIAAFLETATGNILGCNFQAESIFWNASVAPAGAWRMGRSADYHNNSLWGRVANAVGAENMYKVATPYARNIGEGRDVVYVDIVTLADRFNLDMRLVTAVPELDFLEEVYDEAGKSIGGAVGAVVGLIIVGAVATWALLRPLKTLEQRMYDAASFDDSNGEAEMASVITEVKNMQTAYEKMQAQLKKVKSYLPKSVLAALDGEDDDEDAEEVDEVVAPRLSASGMSDSQRGSGKDRLARPSIGGGERELSDKTSSRSHGSSRSGRHVAPAGAVRALNVSEACTRKRTSILHFNLRGFHGATVDNMDSAVALQRHALRAVEVAAGMRKGVLDSFNGDHVVVSFNACTVAPAHPVKAVHCARDILAAIEKLPGSGHHVCSIGVSTGSTLVGNMGSETSKRFCIVGPAYQEAAALERFCKPTGKVLLVSAGIVQNVAHEFYHENVDVVLLSSKPQAMATILGPKAGGPGDEWMYEMERANAADGAAKTNEAFDRFAQGDLSFVAGIVTALATSDKDSAKRLLTMAAAATTNGYAQTRTSELLFLGTVSTVASAQDV